MKEVQILHCRATVIRLRRKVRSYENEASLRLARGRHIRFMYLAVGRLFAVCEV